LISARGCWDTQRCQGGRQRPKGEAEFRLKEKGIRVMRILSDILVGFIALEHLGFMILEMFLWRKPVGLRTFRMTRETADTSAPLAKNQGLYNGFLAAGLLWGLFAPDPHLALSFKYFFLSCVAAAGIFGSLTALRSIFFVQALPALAALLMLCLSLR
jgi:putative membrane protein